MIPIKIHCSCGQRYAFDVEPVAGRMPAPVACPNCGVDGTSAANTVISQQAPQGATREPKLAQLVPAAPVLEQPARAIAPAVGLASPSAAAAPATAPAARTPRLRVALAKNTETSEAPSAATPPADAARPPAPLGRQPDRTKFEREARAKIMWGDDPDDVTKFLMMQGFAYEEASATVQALYAERVATLRGTGIRKIVIGVSLVCVPIVSLIIFLMMGVVPLKLFALTVMVGLYGAWLILRGVLLVVSPKAEHGEVGEA